MRPRIFNIICAVLFFIVSLNLFSQVTGGPILHGRTLNGIKMNSSGNGISVGDNGCLFYTSNSGNSWLIMNSGTENKLNNVSLTLENIFIVTGNNGTLIRSNDMGYTWQQIALNPGKTDDSPSDLLAGTLVSSGKGFICGLSGTLMMTTDFGVTWNEQNSGRNTDLYSVSMSDNNHAILTGSMSTILYTTDGGASWNPPGSSPSVQVNYLNVLMTSSTSAFAVTSLGHIIKSTDCGNTWLIVYQDPQNLPLNKLEIVPGGKIAAIGNGGRILISDDNGTTWSIKNSGTTDDLNCICFRDDLNGFAGGENGIMLRTVDGGLKWTVVDYLPYSNKGKGDQADQSEASFRIIQNFPNPFNPSTIISYSVPFNSFVKLSIFDISGKEIAVLTNGTKNAGFYSAKFDGSNLASGVYFYRIIIEGNGRKFVNTRKMILTK